MTESVDDTRARPTTQALKKQKGARGSGDIDCDMQIVEFVAGLLRLAHAKHAAKIPSLCGGGALSSRQRSQRLPAVV